MFPSYLSLYRVTVHCLAFPYSYFYRPNVFYCEHCASICRQFNKLLTYLPVRLLSVNISEKNRQRDWTDRPALKSICGSKPWQTQTRPQISPRWRTPQRYKVTNVGLCFGCRCVRWYHVFLPSNCWPLREQVHKYRHRVSISDARPTRRQFSQTCINHRPNSGCPNEHRVWSNETPGLQSHAKIRSSLISKWKTWANVL